MSETNRRKFLAAAGAGAAAGVVGITAGPAFAGGAPYASTKAAKETVVAYVEDHHGSTRHADGRRAGGRRPRPRPGHPHPQRGRRRVRCRRTAKHPRSRRTRSPTAPTSTRSSARTSPDYVTLIANFIPLQKPDGGPNFYEFGDDVLYEIHDRQQRQGQGATSSTSSSSTTKIRNHEDLPLQHRPDHQRSATRTGTGRSSTRVTRIEGRPARKAARQEPAPARRSTSARAARRTTPSPGRPGRAHASGNRKVFAGQRADAFHVDLGSIFDLGALRPFNEAAPDLDAEHERRQRAAGATTCTRSRSRCRSPT